MHSPINGVVSRRTVNRGDVVTSGTELFVVIDPSSMRLEASVPSESLSELKIGATVDFEVRGYNQRFQGRVERIAPQADPATRQVPIYVAIPEHRWPARRRPLRRRPRGQSVGRRAGRAEQRGEHRGTPAWALRVRDGKTERVDVTLGLRDARTERVQVVSGLNEGDTLLRGASQGITPGTPVAVSAAQ